jgi:hypothetical protein
MEGGEEPFKFVSLQEWFATRDADIRRIELPDLF